eukprot:TRINITY_DN124216_c0_g1_i1.p1 TRINITY_DN124216_c0_g1~~TRINITY_DN124216_c0_g1_i1.p1  ORF type:complete len:514 (+),score=51.55 TRINITY_DN124216_c0_g1_i1:50-1591(+)
MSCEPSAAQVERARRVILQYPEVRRYEWIEDSADGAESTPKRARTAAGATDESIAVSPENADVVARLIEFLARWQDCSPSAKTRIARMRVREVRNLVRNGFRMDIPSRGDPCRLPCHDDDEVAKEVLEALFRQPGRHVGGFLDDGHVVLAGLELKLLTTDIIREHGRERRQERHVAQQHSVNFYDLHFGAGSGERGAMRELFWGGRDFEWVVPDEKANKYWQTVNKRVRCVKYYSFARQKLSLTDDAALLKKLLKPFGPDQVFIPETARICLATCALSLIKQKDFRRQPAADPTPLARPGSAAAAPSSGSVLSSDVTHTKGCPNEDGVLVSYSSMNRVLALVSPDSEAAWQLAGYERCVRQRDVIASFFAPEDQAQPLDENLRNEQKHRTISLYENLHTIYLPLLVETGSAQDTSPDFTHVIAVLVANPAFDVLPPVIFVDNRFSPEPNKVVYIGGNAPKRLTKAQMAPTRNFIKSAFLNCDIFKRWCRSHSVALDCRFADEHPVKACFGDGT